MSAETTTDVLGRVKAALRSMGRTAEDVADCLWLAAVRGVPGRDGLANPVVRFLCEHIDLFSCRVTIAPGAAEARMIVHGTPAAVELPAAVRAFLERFHRGLHPELEAR